MLESILYYMLIGLAVGAFNHLSAIVMIHLRNADYVFPPFHVNHGVCWAMTFCCLFFWPLTAIWMIIGFIVMIFFD
mgnify:CR=1 FL=1